MTKNTNNATVQKPAFFTLADLSAGKVWHGECQWKNKLGTMFAGAEVTIAGSVQRFYSAEEGFGKVYAGGVNEIVVRDEIHKIAVAFSYDRAECSDLLRNYVDKVLVNMRAAFEMAKETQNRLMRLEYEQE